MLIVAAVLILIGIISRNWISASHGEYRIGPMGLEVCHSSVCFDVPNERGLPNDLELVMLLAVVSGFASAIAAGVFGGMALAKKHHKLPVPRLANIAFGLAAFSFVYFMIRVFTEVPRSAPGWAWAPAIAGVIVGGIGLKRLLAVAPARSYQPNPMPQQPYGQQPYGQPMQPPAMQPPAPPQQQASFCPRCGTQLQFVDQYQRWFCPREQQYL